jgi:hypothetical protein
MSALAMNGQTPRNVIGPKRKTANAAVSPKSDQELACFDP